MNTEWIHLLLGLPVLRNTILAARQSTKWAMSSGIDTMIGSNGKHLKQEVNARVHPHRCTHRHVFCMSPHTVVYFCLCGSLLYKTLYVHISTSIRQFFRAFVLFLRSQKGLRREVHKQRTGNVIAKREQTPAHHCKLQSTFIALL